MISTSLRRRSRTILAAIVAVALVGGCRQSPPLEVSLPSIPADLPQPLSSLLAELEGRAAAAPRDATALSELALAYEANHLWHEARHLWDEAMKLDPNEPLIAYHRALVLEQLGELEAASAGFVRLTESQPGFAPAFDHLGWIRLRQAHLDGAAMAFRTLMRLAPENPGGYLGLAQVRLEQGNFEVASELAAKALEIDPQEYRASYTLGLAYRGLGRVDEARAALSIGTAGSAVEPTDDWSSRLRAHIRRPGIAVDEARRALAAGDAEDAADLARRASEWAPDSLAAHNALAVALLRLRRPEEACRTLAKMLQKDAGHLETRLNLATCAAAMGRQSEALEHAIAAVELAPQVARAHQTYARVLLGQANDPRATRAAIDRLREARRLDPTNVEILRELGFALLRGGEITAAQQSFMQLLTLDSGHPWGYLGLAEVALASGDGATARQALDGARQLAPGHPGIASVATRLEALP